MVTGYWRNFATSSETDLGILPTDIAVYADKMRTIAARAMRMLVGFCQTFLGSSLTMTAFFLVIAHQLLERFAAAVTQKIFSRTAAFLPVSRQPIKPLLQSPL